MCVLCGQPVVARGWCKTHYDRWWRTGDPQALRAPGPKPSPYMARVLNLWLAGWRTKAIARHLGIKMQQVTRYKVALAARMELEPDSVLPAYIRTLRDEVKALRGELGMREAS